MKSTRGDVMDIAAQLEYNFSGMLGSFLKIKPSKSKSLGNKSSALSFNAKLNLILDMNIMSKSEAE